MHPTLRPHLLTHWVGGEPFKYINHLPSGNAPDVEFFEEFEALLTEGELSTMERNQFTSGLFEAAEESTMMLEAIRVYDSWFESVSNH